MQQFAVQLQDVNGSKSMNIMGSLASPKIFSFAPTVSTEIISLTVVLDSAGASPLAGFTGSLTNGILIETVIGGSTKTLQLIKDKSDLVGLFNSAYVEPLNSSSFVGSFYSAPNVPLVLNNGDLIRVTIQDDMIPVGVLNMTAMVAQ